MSLSFPPPQEVDVAILGAGPAGCTAALNLARTCRVLLIERDASPRPRAGESLPPAANQLLRDMGLLDDFRQQGHLPCFGNRSQWGSSAWQESDFLRDPQGHGWHLDRPRFERWLRRHAVARGATLLAPARLAHIERRHDGEGWLLQVQHGEAVHSASPAPGAEISAAPGGQGGQGGQGGACAALPRQAAGETRPQQAGCEVRASGPVPALLAHIRARVVLDAGGRTPVLAKAQGAARVQHDKLVCGWLIAPDSANGQAGLTRLVATEHGWWYCAPLPDQKRILAFYTDHDLPPARPMRSASGLLQLAQQAVPAWLEEFAPLALQHPSGHAPGMSGYTAAHSASTLPAAGDGWLCAGDAALSFDPLSSQGIFNALYTGLAAAESIYRQLRGEIADFADYTAQLARIEHAYRTHLRQWYGSEPRWPDARFWQRRR